MKLLCLCSNSGSSIYDTLMSWKPVISEYYILINNTTDNTYDEIIRTGLDCKVFYRSFKSFSETRNELIKIATKDQSNDHLIFIDDSYELRNPDAFKSQMKLRNDECISISIKRKSQKCRRSLIFKKNCYYTGSIHEVINKGSTYCLSDCFIEDTVYNDHLIRTKNRAEYDKVCLKRYMDPRSNYYKACLETGLKQIELFKNYIEKYDNRYTYLCLLYLSELTNDSVKYLLLAAKQCPLLAPECYFKIYQMTKDSKYLLLSRENCEVIPDTDLPYNEGLFGSSGIIMICSLKYLVLKQIKSFEFECCQKKT